MASPIIQLRISDNDPYTYVQPSNTGSAVIGTDQSDSNKLKVVMSSAVGNLDPSSGTIAAGTCSMSIDPTVNGNIEFCPKGSGQTNFARGSVQIEAQGSTAGNLIMNDTSAAGLSGVIEFGGESSAYRFIHNYGTRNIFEGQIAGTFSLTTAAATDNTGIGFNALNGLTTGPYNTAIGSGAGSVISSGYQNTVIGMNSLTNCTTGTDNTVIGFQSLSNTNTGHQNTMIGSGAGGSLTGTDSNNIFIGYSVNGSSGDNTTIRLGLQSGVGSASKCFIAGISGATVTPAGTVVINSSGQLGTSSSLPIAVPVTVPNGGTGDITLAADGVLYGNGTSPVGVTAAGTNGQVLIGATSAAPAFATLTSSGGTITFTTGANTLNLEAVASSSFTWSVITSNQTAAINNGYICNKAGTLALLLPATSAVGSLLEVTGINTATGWQITQASGQQIFFGTTSTTSGASGSLASTNIRDSVKLVCVVANTVWNVLSSVGNLTVT